MGIAAGNPPTGSPPIWADGPGPAARTAGKAPPVGANSAFGFHPAGSPLAFRPATWRPRAVGPPPGGTFVPSPTRRAAGGVTRVTGRHVSGPGTHDPENPR